MKTESKLKQTFRVAYRTANAVIVEAFDEQDAQEVVRRAWASQIISGGVQIDEVDPEPYWMYPVRQHTLDFGAQRCVEHGATGGLPESNLIVPEKPTRERDPETITEPLVFLSDETTFTGIGGATILLGNYAAQYDIGKLFSLATSAMLAAAEVAVLQSSVDEAMNGCCE